MNASLGSLIKYTALSSITAALLFSAVSCGRETETISEPVPQTKVSATNVQTTAVPTAVTTVTTTEQATAPPVITNAPDKVLPQGASPEDATIPKGTASPNVNAYQDNIYVYGDSICHGFNVYNFVPHEHCLTQSSVSMWNLDYFTFDTPAGTLGTIDAVEAVKPKLLYMSLGMNDLKTGDANTFSTKYLDVAKQIIERVPDINIVIAGITPIDPSIASLTTNDMIRSYNTALRTAVSNANSDRIFYFDAYAVLADPDTLDLKAGSSSGDGIHLSPPCYSELLTNLYMMLDTTPVKGRLAG